MSIENVKAYFKQFNMEEKIIEFPISSETVELAAIALNVEPARIAKTMAFLVNDKQILIVSAGDAKIDNRKYMDYFHTKAKMIKAEDVEILVGHAVGGVCPFAIKENIVVYLDDSLKRFKTVFPGCGSGNSTIELTIDELERFSNFNCWIEVCKGWRNDSNESFQ